MGYAIRNDRQGYRAVDGPDDVGEHEYYSEVPEDVLPLAPTYQSELAELNAAYQIKVDGYNRSFAIAALSDGPTEEAKKLAIRADYEAAKAQNSADRAALKVKYGFGGV